MHLDYAIIRKICNLSNYYSFDLIAEEGKDIKLNMSERNV